MSDMTSTEKKRRLILFSLLGVALAVSILLASFFLFSPEKLSATASLTSARTDAISGKAGGEGSEEYNQKLKEHDARQANEALKTGESFIPTPVGQRKPVVMKKEDTPPPVPPVAPVRTAPVQTPRTDNTMLKRMMDDLRRWIRNCPPSPWVKAGLSTCATSRRKQLLSPRLLRQRQRQRSQGTLLPP